MATAQDVAAYIVQKQGPMTAMKLQKLVYYAQAWHLVWEERPLFGEDIQAWANGPVVYDLYRKHRGQFRVDEWPWGDPANLNPDEAESVDVVLEAYGEFNAHQLSEMTHREQPWLKAREGMPDGARSSEVITPAMLHEYYHGLSD